MIRWKRSKIRWEGLLQPTDLCATYTVRIDYSLEGPPEIRVTDPPLRKRSDGKPIPHLYTGEMLCLYYPVAEEWHERILIARTIVPWTSEWLYFYEMWHASGTWLGKGIEHQPVPRTPPRGESNSVR